MKKEIVDTKKERKVSKALSKWYEDETKAINTVLKTPLFWYIIMLIPCLLGGYLFSFKELGYGAFRFNEGTYEYIEGVMRENLNQSYDDNGELLGAGLDGQKLREMVDGYAERYKDGKLTLECVIKDGYFEAIMTAELSDNYEIIGEPSKNYPSTKEYAEQVRYDLGIRTLIYAVIAWVACILAVSFLRIVLCIFKALIKKDTKSKEIDEPKLEVVNAEENKSA